jgi:hypothetical protein
MSVPNRPIRDKQTDLITVLLRTLSTVIEPQSPDYFADLEELPTPDALNTLSPLCLGPRSKGNTLRDHHHQALKVRWIQVRLLPLCQVLATELWSQYRKCLEYPASNVLR